MKNTTWLQHVEEGKAIVAKLSESEIHNAEWRLALGEKAEEVTSGGTDRLAEYATEIGVTLGAIFHYRTIAVAVRNADTTGMSWAAIRQLASVKGDKQVVLDEIKTAKPNKESISRHDILEYQGTFSY